MAVTDVLQFYHLKAWRQKIGGRPLLYVALAYALAGQWRWWPMVLNALAVCGLFMFANAFDDYWDFRLQREPNALSVHVAAGRLTPTSALLLTCAPLLLVMPLPLAAAQLSLPSDTIRWMIAATLAIVLGYSVPPVRLKDRLPWGFLTAPVLAPLLFTLSVVVLRPMDAFLARFVWLLFLFQAYAEAIHVVDNAGSRPPPRKLSAAAARRLMQWLPLASLASALVFALSHRAYLLTACASVLRWRAARQFSAEQLSRHRRNLLSPLWSLFEFVAYAALGVWYLAR